MDPLPSLSERTAPHHSLGIPKLSTIFAFLIVSSLLVVTCKSLVRYPPGPPRLPLLGNVFQLPSVRPWETYSKWAKHFNSDILYLNVLGFPIVILDSAKVAKDLLEKRSAIYSDRPKFPFFDLMGWSWAIQFMRYGEKFRRHRRPLQINLSPASLRDYWPAQHREVHSLLKDLLHSPQHFFEHSKHAAAGMAMTMLYGIERGPARTALIQLAEQATESLVAAGNFGDHLVDLVPLMKHIPEWLPGAGFQRQARAWRTLCERMINVPFEDHKERASRGDLEPCLVAKLLEEQAAGHDPDMTDYLIKSTAGVIYLGGADTTLSALQTFFLAMTLYPDVQKRAQAQIDAVCGQRRLPTLADKPAMPYLECVMRELLRWNPTTPLGVPHSLSQDDVYGAYTIPKGSTVMTNLWSIFHDPATYPEPSTFRPERYLCGGEIDPAAPDPRLLAFGHGRRTCPGRFLADAVLWLVFARVLAVFEVGKERRADGTLVVPCVAYSTGLVSRPLPFRCDIRPRGEAARELILAEDVGSND